MRDGPSFWEAGTRIAVSCTVGEVGAASDLGSMSFVSVSCNSKSGCSIVTMSTYY
jgi:hypothetical protein